MDIKELIILELKANGIEANESKIDLYILKVTSRILNYCHIKLLPAELNETVASIVIDMIKNDISIESNEGIKSIQEGDTSITFETKKEINNKDIIMSYYNIINKFRVFNGFR